MEREMLAVEGTMKIEVGEVKLETKELENGSVGIKQIAWEPAIKYNKDENTDETGLSRIKNECIVKDWSNEDALEMQDKKIKLEKDLNCKELEISEINEEFIIKDENDCDGLKDANTEILLNRIKNEHNYDEAWSNKEVLQMHDEKIKLEKDSDCEELKVSEFTEELVIKNENDCNDSKDANSEIISNSALKLKIHRRQHPLLKTADRDKLSMCTHCNEAFYKTHLDDHTIKKHPDSIASISSEILECSHCAYKTVRKYSLAKHMLKHPQTVDSYKLRTCVHCNVTYKNKTNLDDHIIKKHPDSIASISSKIHQCTSCTFKTTVKSHFCRHILKHESADRYKLTVMQHLRIKGVWKTI